MRFLLVCLALLVAVPALAVQPDEILADPALEARAREISKELRCLVCQNESIDDSNAELARDLRILVRERLTAGDTDEQAVAYIADRYGEFVLLKPRFSLANSMLWLTGPLAFLIGLAVIAVHLRRRQPRAAAREAPLSVEEKAELERLLKE